MKIRNILFLLIFILLGNAVNGQDAQEIIKKVQANYNGINDAKASFSHTGKNISESGTIYIQKESKYRI